MKKKIFFVVLSIAYSLFFLFCKIQNIFIIYVKLRLCKQSLTFLKEFFKFCCKKTTTNLYGFNKRTCTHH